MHDAYDAVNVICAVFPNVYAVITWTHRFWPASGRLGCGATRAQPVKHQRDDQIGHLTVRHPAG